MGNALRIAMARLNVWVGDIEGNAEQMISAARCALRPARHRQAGTDLLININASPFHSGK